MAWRYPSELARMPKAERIRWQIYNKGFDRGMTHCHLMPATPYRRRDYRIAWEEGYSDGRKSMEEAHRELRLAREKGEHDE